MPLSVNSARYMPSLAERARLHVAVIDAARRAREHGIISPEKSQRDQEWIRGDLRSKLDPTQQRIYDAIKASPFSVFATEGARKLGKSFAHGVIALETVIQNPGKRVNWAAITGKESRGVLLPILEEISHDAPAQCRGHHNHGENRWVMPNGSYIQLIGADTRKDCEKGRGPSSILSIVDEAGFHDHLQYLVDSILEPQMRRVPRRPGSFVGMTLLVSTTPYSPLHGFCKMADAAAAHDAYMRLTIWDAGWEASTDEERIEKVKQYIAKKAEEKNLTVESFMATSTFRREWNSERVQETDRVVVPEMSIVGADGFTGEQRIVKEWPRPIGFHPYVYKRTAVDPGGMVDPSGVLSGFVDFTNARVVIEGERMLMRANTHDLFTAVVEMETELWGPPPDPPPGQPYLDRSRISRPVDDPTGRVTLDLWEIDKLHCEPAVKNDRKASIGLIRTYVADGTLVVHPRCVNLISQMKNALSNPKGTDFERVVDPEGISHHNDLLAALMYFCRGLSLTTDPYPNTFDRATGEERNDDHPVMARRAAMGVGREKNGLAAQILGGNRFVQDQLKRRLK